MSIQLYILLKNNCIMDIQEKALKIVGDLINKYRINGEDAVILMKAIINSYAANIDIKNDNIEYSIGKFTSTINTNQQKYD